MTKYYFCFDVGGTDIKGGVIDEKNKIICKDKISSSSLFTDEKLENLILKLASNLENSSGFKLDNASGVAIAIPGLTDCKNGIIKNCSNLPLKNYDIVNKLSKKINSPVKIGNDAELALIAEQKLGSGKKFNNFALVTIGTGIGCGLVLDGKPLRSILPYSSELGHLLNYPNTTDTECSASTKALNNMTKQAMINNKNSKLWDKYTPETVNSKAIFEYLDSDETAKNVFCEFIDKLSTTIANLFTLFTPELIVVGGAISIQGDKLLKPLEKMINDKIFLKTIGIKTKLVPAKFLNDAGIVGGKCLFD